MVKLANGRTVTSDRRGNAHIHIGARILSACKCYFIPAIRHSVPSAFCSDDHRRAVIISRETCVIRDKHDMYSLPRVIHLSRNSSLYAGTILLPGMNMKTLNYTNTTKTLGSANSKIPTANRLPHRRLAHTTEPVIAYLIILERYVFNSFN